MAVDFSFFNCRHNDTIISESELICLIKRLIANHKLTIIHLLIGIIICLIIMAPFLLNKGIYVQDDFSFHRVRLESYYGAVISNNFFPKIFQNMANGYGYAADLFYPSILLYPYAILRMLGFSYLGSYNGYMLLICIATFVSAYFSAKPFFKKDNPSLLFAIIYVTSTYRLLDQFVRGALGETLSFVFLPMVFLGLYRIFYQEDSKNGWVILGVSMALLIHAHFITAYFVVIAIGIMLIFQLFLKRLTKYRLLEFLKATVLGLLLSAYILLPILEQNLHIDFNYIENRTLWSNGLKYSFFNLLSNSLANSADTWGDLKPGIGVVLVLFVLIAITRFKRLTGRTKLLLVIGIAFSLLTTNLFPWVLFKTSFLSFVQFPWRLLTLATLFLSLAFTSFIDDLKIPRNAQTGLSVLLVVLSISFSTNALYDFQQKNIPNLTNETYGDYALSSIGGGREYLPANMDADQMFDNPDNNPAILNENATVYEIVNDSNKYNEFTYSIISADNQLVTLPKIAYKGYEVEIDGQKVAVTNKKGLLSFKVTKGDHTVRAIYKGTFVQKASLVVSLMVWAIILIIPSKSLKLPKKKKTEA